MWSRRRILAVALLGPAVGFALGSVVMALFGDAGLLVILCLMAAVVAAVLIHTAPVLTPRWRRVERRGRLRPPPE